MSEPKPMMTKKQADELVKKLDALCEKLLFDAPTIPAGSPKAKKLYAQMLSCADAQRKAAGVRA